VIIETYLFLAEIVREVSDHDLSSRGNAVLWRTTLLWLARSSNLGLRGLFRSLVGFVGDVGERKVFSDGIAFSGSLTQELEVSQTLYRVVNLHLEHRL